MTYHMKTISEEFKELPKSEFPKLEEFIEKWCEKDPIKYCPKCKREIKPHNRCIC